jgi:hypothetical protein
MPTVFLDGRGTELVDVVRIALWGYSIGLDAGALGRMRAAAEKAPKVPHKGVFVPPMDPLPCSETGRLSVPETRALLVLRIINCLQVRLPSVMYALHTY